jgi:hypothetical protein
VSNKDTDTTGERGDPIEGLLYATFVASTERADVASLVGDRCVLPCSRTPRWDHDMDEALLAPRSQGSHAGDR